MNKESVIELQRIDCNCNDCAFMVRDLEKMRSFDHLYPKDRGKRCRINYGQCTKKAEPVSFIPNHNMTVENRDCFKHRRDK